MTNLKQILKASYKNQKKAKNDLENLRYKYDSNLSSNDAKVFTDADGKPHIVHRSTHKMRLQDLKSDVMLGLGLQNYDKRLREAKHTTKFVRDKYNKEPDVFGHSLGGALAEKSESKENITTYNKAAGLGDIGKTIPKTIVFALLSASSFSIFFFSFDFSLPIAKFFLAVSICFSFNFRFGF